MEGLINRLLAEAADLLGYEVKEKGPITSWSDMFWYQFPAIEDLAAGATGAAVTITIQNDSDFEWIESVYQFSLAEAAQTFSDGDLPNMLVTIVDTGSGKNLMNAAVPVTAMFGNHLFGPIKLPQPKILLSNSTISITPTNFDAAVANGRLYLTLIGRKLYNLR